MLLSPVIAALLEILGDGKWHSLTELQQKIGVASYKVKGVATLLGRFDFAVVDEAKEKVKISKNFQKFLACS